MLRRSHKIMMVDDEPANLHIVKLILNREHTNADLLLFESGEEALAYLEQDHAVDLIVLDLAMPGLDGFDVLQRLKQNPATEEIPVLFLTAFTDTEYILKAFELGATDFIGKPIISPVLTARIQAVLQTQALKNQLQVSNEELVNTNRLKDELLSIVSHDLRSPLSAIELLCQFLQDALQGKGQQSQEELINRILNQSRLSRRLVENLLNLNRVEEGILVPEASFFSLHELMQACADDELPILQSRKLSFDMEPPPEDVLCYGDREMMAQVLRNVLGNAIKFADTRVALTCTVRDFSEQEGGWMRIAVEDDGEGIPAEQRDTIFEKYATGDRRGGGSGLGLYISRQMVELHGGRIWADSTAGQGTCVNFELPNLFRAEQLPDLSPHVERSVLVASPSRTAAQMFEALLVEGGLLEVDVRVLDSEGDDRPAQREIDVALVDLSNEGVEPGRLATRLQHLSVRAGWLCHGDSAMANAFGERIGQPWAHVGRPLNPLVLFRELESLLNADRPANRSMSG